ncbi:MAG: hypothetical protein GTO18_11950 [Anaerolineales bacterium]|nr:hypothetical protein [Anaerolineales bacterium]
MGDSLNTELLPNATEMELPSSRSAYATIRGAFSILLNPIRIGKISLFIISIFLFISAINLMKEGAQGMGPLLQETLSVTNAANCLGFGWMFAYIMMSGSPVAAAALSFFDAGVIDSTSAFAMITGSRLGASFIVLLIGFLYVLRGRNKTTSLSMGLLSLSVTATTYTLGFFLGLNILKLGTLDHVQFHWETLFISALDTVFLPITKLCTEYLPRWVLFILSTGIITISFSLFDRCLPKMTIKESYVGRVSRLVYRPWVMFTLGAAITLLSMSVSISLSILVPLSTRGFVRRENVIPYIMGANITTFVDTLLASLLMNNPHAFSIVFVEMVCITIVSILILITTYRRYERGMIRFVDWVTSSNRNLFVTTCIILGIPLILMRF